jgi:hypothetical protein
MRKVLLIASAAYPASCLASGGDALSLLWLEAALFAAVVVSLALVSLPVSRKFLVFAAYVLGLALAVAVTWNLPARDNRLLGTVVLLGLPSLMWLGALVLLIGGKNITSRWRATR